MRGRAFELLFVVAMVAVYVGYVRPNFEGTTEPPSPTATVELAPDAVRFQLPTVGGQDFRFEPDGQRWTFLTLTATGCADCVAKQDIDREAMERFRKLGGRSYALLLFGTSQTLANFAKRHPSAADEVLADIGGEVGVKQLKGSDSHRWLLIAPDGKLAWQGESSWEQLEAMLP